MTPFPEAGPLGGDASAAGSGGPIAHLLPHAPEMHGFRGALEQALGVSIRARHQSPKELSRAIVRKLREQGIEEAPSVGLPQRSGRTPSAPLPGSRPAAASHDWKAAERNEGGWRAAERNEGGWRAAERSEGGWRAAERSEGGRAARLRERLIRKLSASGEFAGKEEEIAARLLPGRIGDSHGSAAERDGEGRSARQRSHPGAEGDVVVGAPSSLRRFSPRPSAAPSLRAEPFVTPSPQVSKRDGVRRIRRGHAAGGPVPLRGETPAPSGTPEEGGPASAAKPAGGPASAAKPAGWTPSGAREDGWTPSGAREAPALEGEPTAWVPASVQGPAEEEDDEENDDNLSTRGKVKARLRAKKRRAARRSKAAAQAVAQEGLVPLRNSPSLRSGNLRTPSLCSAFFQPADVGSRQPAKPQKRVMFREPIEQEAGGRAPQSAERIRRFPQRASFQPLAGSSAEGEFSEYTLEDEQAALVHVPRSSAKQRLLDEMAFARQRATQGRSRHAGLGLLPTAANREAAGAVASSMRQAFAPHLASAASRKMNGLAQEIQLEYAQRKLASAAKANIRGRHALPSPRTPDHGLQAAARRQEAEARARAEMRARSRLQALRSSVIEPPSWSGTQIRPSSSAGGLARSSRQHASSSATGPAFSARTQTPSLRSGSTHTSASARAAPPSNDALRAAASSFSVRPRRACKCGGGGRWK